MGRGAKKVLSIIRNVVFTGVNIMLGILVSIVMAGGDFLHLLFAMVHREELVGFDLFFDTYVISPLAAIIYFALTIGFVIYQGRVSALHRLYLNVVMFLVSCSVLIKVIMLFG